MLTHQVHQCEFCPASFRPRPQVKNPRACERSECQRRRQRSNELSWRQRNSTASDPKYHRLRKQARLGQLRRVSLLIGRCFNTGARFLGESMSLDPVQALFLQFLVSLGIRKINKLWPAVLFQSEPVVT